MTGDIINKQKVNRSVQSIFRYIFCFIGVFLSIYPLYFIIVSSLKSNTEIFASPFTPPSVFNFDNYVRAIEIGGLGRQFINSLILSISSLFVTLVLSSMVAFAISRLKFKIKNLIRVYFVMGMMVPIQSIIVPIAFAANTLGIRDN
ncbi:MAG: hypothetical protein LBD47_10325 [Treponema sp.]|jgi:raffinose/stachyose/melibiose transport system permease protein|nr:hypothetical protein [Treponema sp.]